MKDATVAPTGARAGSDSEPANGKQLRTLPLPLGGQGPVVAGRSNLAQDEEGTGSMVPHIRPQ